MTYILKASLWGKVAACSSAIISREEAEIKGAIGRNNTCQEPTSTPFPLPKGSSGTFYLTISANISLFSVTGKCSLLTGHCKSLNKTISHTKEEKLSDY